MMAEETFLSLLPFLNVVPEGGFWLSCLYEPTLHPQLNRFLSLIPSDQRKKVWFTTNLTRTLSSEQLTGWAESRIHHINVSLDTTDPELFGVLRKNGRYDVFERNLNTLAEVLDRHPDAPKLRFITVAFRSNMSEIPALVQRARDQWHACDHEVRFAFNVGHIPDEFRREHFMTAEDWSMLSDALAKIDAPHTVSYPPRTGISKTRPSRSTRRVCTRPSSAVATCAPAAAQAALRAGRLAHDRGHGDSFPRQCEGSGGPGCLLPHEAVRSMISETSVPQGSSYAVRSRHSLR